MILEVTHSILNPIDYLFWILSSIKIGQTEVRLLKKISI